MKKMYVKPMVYMERFELSKHIADCAWELKSVSTDSCHAVPDDKKLPVISDYLFQSDINTCTTTPDKFEDYCNQNANPNVNVFAS